MLVLRPADAEETTVAWKLAMENTSTPPALIFSRQNIANLPAGNDYSQAAKGAYIVAGSDVAEIQQIEKIVLCEPQRNCHCFKQQKQQHRWHVFVKSVIDSHVLFDPLLSCFFQYTDCRAGATPDILL